MKVILGFLLVFLTSCSGLLYYPTNLRYVDVQLLKYQPEDVFFHENKEKHERLMGWYFKSPETKKNPKNPKPLFIFFHGNAQNISSHFVSLFWILDEGYDYFIFDYPGYGGSFGEPNPKNTVESGILAIEYARKRWPNKPLVVFGQSLGGAVSLRSVIDLKDRSQICAHVVESTFDSYQRVGRAAMASSWITWLFQPLAYVVLSDKYAPYKRIHEISPIPLLVIHRKKDPIVPYYLGENVFNQAQNPKEFWSVEGEGHIDALTSENPVNQRELNRKKLLEFVAVCSKIQKQ